MSSPRRVSAALGAACSSATAAEVAMDAAELSGAHAALRFAHDRVHGRGVRVAFAARREATHLALGRQLLREVGDGDGERSSPRSTRCAARPPRGLTRDDRLQLAALSACARPALARQQAAFRGGGHLRRGGHRLV
ncbi:MAG: hypothetical protein IPN17_35060 [Deltaproteobacteria bacterium]|nr:hypothetical protein [Deltaproteobacteria bacterium]